MNGRPNVAAFLADLIGLIKEDARATRNACAAATVEDRIFLEGKLLGYNEVISTIRNQARAFGFDLGDLQLEDIDPDRDLVP